MVEDFVFNMLNNNIELRKHCASAIFKCAQEEETRALVKSNGGLEPLVALIKVDWMILEGDQCTNRHSEINFELGLNQVG